MISNETRVQRSEKRRERGQTDSRRTVIDWAKQDREREREIRAEMERGGKYNKGQRWRKTGKDGQMSEEKIERN